MQDRYVGDIGDFVKYALLRTLMPGYKLGMAWYLYPNEGHNNDGLHTQYLDQPKKWRDFDPELFDALHKIRTDHRRQISSVEEAGLLPNARFSGHPLAAPDQSTAEKREFRKNWFIQTHQQLAGTDLVFLDPDNGLCDDGKFRYSGADRSWKRLPITEARHLAEGRTAILYHHNSRFPGGHEKEIQHWLDKLGKETLALKWHRISCRTFFIVHPTALIKQRLNAFQSLWIEHTSIYP